MHCWLSKESLSQIQKRYLYSNKQKLLPERSYIFF